MSINLGKRVIVLDAAVLLEAKRTVAVNEIWITSIPPKEVFLFTYFIFILISRWIRFPRLLGVLSTGITYHRTKRTVVWTVRYQIKNDFHMLMFFFVPIRLKLSFKSNLNIFSNYFYNESMGIFKILMRFTPILGAYSYFYLFYFWLL